MYELIIIGFILVELSIILALFTFLKVITGCWRIPLQKKPENCIAESQAFALVRRLARAMDCTIEQMPYFLWNFIDASERTNGMHDPIVYETFKTKLLIALDEKDNIYE